MNQPTNMNCQDIQANLHDYLDGELGNTAVSGVETHLRDCGACQALIAEERQLREQLRDLPVAPMSEGFVDRAMRIAETQHHSTTEKAREHKRHGFLLGFGSALAAGLALWAVVSLFPLTNGSLQDTVHGVQIALHDTHKLKLSFNSEIDLEGATISIMLPQNVALVGYPGERQLSWKTNLNKGDNTLTLPIKALQAHNGELIAKVEHGRQVKTLKVKLQVLDPGMSQGGVLPTTVS